MTYIPWILTGVSILIAFLSYQHNSGNDSQSLREGILKANMKLDQACATLNSVSVEIKALEKRITQMDKEFSNEISVVKRDLKTAFNRIDELKGEHRHENVD